jgi:hypothetical protein
MAETTASSVTPSQVQKRPYHGSCHCGGTKYIIWAGMEPVNYHIDRATQKVPANNVRAYKCNCTICHKRGLFHVRVLNAPADFALLTPLDPFKELGDYRCNGKAISFFFCKTCGASPFSFFGDGEVVTRTDIPGQEGKEVKVWAPSKATFDESKYLGYLSINAQTLEPNQEGLDLRIWTENKGIEYIDQLNELEESCFDRPAVGGAY